MITKIRNLMIVIAVTVVCNCALAGHQEFQNPTILIDGINYRIVFEDRKTGETFYSQTSFCRLQGYRWYSFSENLIVDSGPYAVISGNGEVDATYPSEGNDSRFYVLANVTCTD